MMFDGKAFAREIEDRVAKQVKAMAVKSKIVSLLVGNDPASELYTRLKSKAAERVGIDFEVMRVEDSGKLKEVLSKVVSRDDVTGVMIQLPIPGVSRKDTEEIIKEIPLTKDVDGLRWRESGVKPATVRGILSIIDSIAYDKNKFVVFGARGAVGSPLVHYLKEGDREVSEIEWDTPNTAGRLPEGEVIISCVGKAGLITADMVSSNMIVIDVGMSEVGGKVVGDMIQEVYQKVSYAVGVPNGVGPVTIASLLENAVDFYGMQLRKNK